MVTEIFGHKIIRIFKPITYAGVSSGDYVSVVILGFTVVGLCLALSGNGYGPERATA
jgi:hypothetical protein